MGSVHITFRQLKSVFTKAGSKEVKWKFYKNEKKRGRQEKKRKQTKSRVNDIK